ncbi:MAG: hypothetical protein QOJ76_113 [Acidobacteriota bacterium]|nr:hypothetical protein [Acidobacteriota bacterium]
MTKRKDMAGKDDERQVRGKTGPPSATKNERAQGRTRKGGGGASRAVPKVGKHDSAGDSAGDDSGGGLH